MSIYPEVDYFSYANKNLQYYGVAQQVKDLIEKGISPEKIAIISRKHQSLKEISKFLTAFNLPINYEKQNNIFDQKIIQEIIDIIIFTTSVHSNQTFLQEDLLTKILNSKFWELSPFVCYKLAILKKGLDNDLEEEILQKNQITKLPNNWLETARIYPDEKLNQVANFLINLSLEANNCSAEEFLDYIIGNRKLQDFTSPYKSYYFKDLQSFEYLKFLNYLTTFFSHFRKFSGNLTYSLDSLTSFIKMHQENQIPITAILPKEENIAINLLTAHKAKGLEFEIVFLINVNQSEWFSTHGNNSKISLPKNLPLSPEKDRDDDKLRLFFVAITRAESHLTLTSYQKNENDKDVPSLPCLAEYKSEQINNHQNLHKALEIANKSDQDDEIVYPEIKNLLEPFLRKYKLSVTHLNNFVNLSKVGPINFVKDSLLKFPKAKNINAIFGTAMHDSIRSFYNQYKTSQILPTVQDLQEYFAFHLKRAKLPPKDFNKNLKKGQENLQTYYQKSSGEWKIDDIIEKDFNFQNCFLEKAQLTGKIDKMTLDRENQTIIVTDFKTGKSFLSFDIKSDDDHIKTKKEDYKRQLIFYKIMLKKSNDFANYEMENGVIEFLDNVSLDTPNKVFYNPTQEEVENLEKLISVVYKKIVNFEIPTKEDLEKYKNKEGEFDNQSNQSFIQDLLEGEV